MRTLISGLAAAALSVISSPVNAGQKMLTSWYGPGFQGNLTANGEVYNMYGLTAAHKTLPFGTRLRVCYNSCVDVRINDRGPFIGGRQLDLSKGAAAKIGLLGVGVGYTDVTFL